MGFFPSKTNDIVLPQAKVHCRTAAAVRAQRGTAVRNSPGISVGRDTVGYSTISAKRVTPFALNTAPRSIRAVKFCESEENREIDRERLKVEITTMLVYLRRR